MAEAYRVGTRKSPLALRQVVEALRAIKASFPDMLIEVLPIDTYGDKDKDTPVSDTEGSDFFTREIDNALLEKRIDFAVHSAKDLPDEPKEGIIVAAMTESIDPYDVIVSKDGLGLKELAKGAVIGTSSKRRKESLKKFRPDFNIVDIRGNIEERLELLDNGAKNLDAIVIAAAGLIRLGLENRITQKIPINIIEPHPLQGCLAVVIREQDRGLLDIFSVLNKHEEAL
ncbi:MAG: hydroxymethylbilane synthase, partial [Candidatus Omnitrophica bacterium]|nr:hydroxymethylbilane synthase [Candidatus Omnitrophota bacterium]